MANVTRQYLRQVRVDVLGPLTGQGLNVRHGLLAIEGLRIEFELRSELQPTASPSTVKIYNLRRESASLIGDPGQLVEVRAGYGDIRDVRASEPVASGDIRRVLHEDTGVDRVTTIVIGGSDRQTSSTIRVEIPGPVRLREVVRQIIEAMGMAVGPLDAIPDYVQLTDGYSRTGAGMAALRDLLEPRGLTAYEIAGTVHIAGSDQPLAGGVFDVSERTGMIGSPALTDTGVRVKLALNGALQLDQTVELHSLRLNGRFKVVSIVHRGDNWGGEFVTEIEAKSLTEPGSVEGTVLAGRPEIPVGHT